MLLSTPSSGELYGGSNTTHTAGSTSDEQQQPPKQLYQSPERLKPQSQRGEGSGAPSPQPSSSALPPGAALHPGPPRRLPGPGALSPAALPAPGARRTWAPRSLHSEHAAGGQQAEAQPQSQPSRRHVAGPGRRPPPRGGLPVRRRGCGGSGSGAGSAPHGGAVAPRSSGLGAVGGGRSGAMGFLRGAGRH